MNLKIFKMNSVDTASITKAQVHSPHLGYVSLFPLILGHLPCDHPYAARLLRTLQPPGQSKAGELWSAYGVLSLSSKDKLFRSGEDYWRHLAARLNLKP